MTLPSKIVRRGPADLLLAALAFVLLVFFRVCLAVIPVRRIIQAIMPAPDQGGTKPADAAASDRDLRLARRVQWAVSAVARHSFVEFVCFPQTLTAYTLLRWRKVNGTMVYGVARSPEGELIAHTWLEVGDKIVTGGEGAANFTPVERWS
jgi:Transglutaminase-like superfamily